MRTSRSCRLASPRLASPRLASPRLSVVAVVVGAMIVGAACGDPPDAYEGSVDDEHLKEQQQAFSSTGIERVIPLRIVQMASDCMAPPDACRGAEWRAVPDQAVCSVCSDGDEYCGPDTLDYAELKSTLERANWALRTLGVQFYIKSIEKYKMPYFWDIVHGQNPIYRWDDAPPQVPLPTLSLRQQLRMVYPSLSDTAFEANANTEEGFWLHAATIRAGDPREVIMYVAECSHGGDGRRVRAGAASFTGDRAFTAAPRAFAHELGHVLGLEHTMYPQYAPNPEAVSDTPSNNEYEYWDLMYGVEGGVNQYFSSRTAAVTWGLSGKAFVAKHIWIADPYEYNCAADHQTCTIQCTINGEVQNLGDPGMYGLGFTFAGDAPGSGVFHRGFNAMTYMPVNGAPPEGDFFSCPWTTFSESQAQQVKRILRSDIRIDDWSVATPAALGYTSNRYLLGDMRAISGFSKMDFDGDAWRDIPVWQPPGTPGAGATTGKFRILRSGGLIPPYNSLSAITRDFGLTGDVPVPADYDGDGKTDLAVVRSGGFAGDDPHDDNLIWLWCKSSANHDCGSYGSRTFGKRGDVPLPGLDFDGNPATGELAVFRRGTGIYDYIDWRTLTTPFYQSGSIAIRAIHDEVVHLHGLYDSDNKTDVVVYQPRTATFFMQLSTRNWSYIDPVSRSFDAALIPNAVGATGAGSAAPAMRHGGVVLPAENNGRRVLRAWDPITRQWHTNWDPVNSSGVQICTFGAVGDVPVAGPIDRNLDGKTEMVVFRPWTTPPVIAIKNSTAFFCNGAEYSVNATGATPRSLVAAVHDMAGSQDGRGDLMIIDPEQMSWRRFYSQSDGSFTAQTVRNWGDLGGMPF